eukprot:1159838-Pelagomonas_calceolata.AAC.3
MNAGGWQCIPQWHPLDWGDGIHQATITKYHDIQAICIITNMIQEAQHHQATKTAAMVTAPQLPGEH